MGKRRINIGVDIPSKTCGVYMIVSPTNRRYVGSSIDVYDRLCSHRRCEASGPLYYSIKKYGWDSHKKYLLFRCNPEKRLMWERIFGDLYLCMSDLGGLNNNLPGYEDIPKIVSDETRKKNGIAHTKYTPEEYKIRKREMMKLAKERLRKKRIELYGDRRTFGTPEHMAKIRELSVAARQTPEFSQKNRELAYKRYSDPLERERISKSLKEYYCKFPEARKIISERNKKIFSNPKNHPKSKKVIDLITGEIFCSAKTVAEKIGINHYTLRSRLNGKTINNTSYRWANEENKKIAA